MAKLSNAQADLLKLMAANVRPTLKAGPASVVKLPQPHDRRWRQNHGGKPVQENTLQALVKRDLVSRFGTNGTWVYQITATGRAAARGEG